MEKKGLLVLLLLLPFGCGGCVFVIDPKKEHIAVHEARRLGIDINDIGSNGSVTQGGQTTMVD